MEKCFVVFDGVQYYLTDLDNIVGNMDITIIKLYSKEEINKANEYIKEKNKLI